MQDGDHIPVLLQQVLACCVQTPPSSQSHGTALLTTNPVTFLDATAGLGGHAAAIAQYLPAGSTVALNDLDTSNLAHAVARVAAVAPHVRILSHHGNFAAIPRWATQNNLRANILLADLGFASPQVDDPSRGLSFMRDGPLDMRLDQSKGTTAAELVASLPESDLAQIIFDYGEERHSRAIARDIVAARRQTPITTTAALAEIVRAALRGKVPPKEVSGTDPSTKTFQALRIAVNDELGNLDALLEQVEKAARAASTGGGWLAPGAAVAFISFHSLEDRPVKHALARMVEANLAHDITRKPLTASEDELATNPRARSAKLRAVRIGPPPAR